MKKVLGFHRDQFDKQDKIAGAYLRAVAGDTKHIRVKAE